MREIGLEVEINKVVSVKEIGTKEEITSVNHQLSSKSLEISTRVFNSRGEVIKSEYTIIEGENYETLVENSGLLIDSELIWSILDEMRAM